MAKLPPSARLSNTNMETILDDVKLFSRRCPPNKHYTKTAFISVYKVSPVNDLLDLPDS